MARTLTLPLVVSPDGAFQTVTHNHPAEIAQSVALLIATRPGERRSNPEYGFEDVNFDGVSAELVNAAIAEWEPRAVPGSIDTTTLGVGQTTTVTLDSTGQEA